MRSRGRRFSVSMCILGSQAIHLKMSFATRFVPACHLPYLRFFNQLTKLGLLSRCEVVFDADEKHELGALDFALCAENLLQLRSGLLLVHLGLFEQRDQAFHLVLEGPLKLCEFRLGLANLKFDTIFLLVAESDGLLVLHDGLGWEQDVA